MSQDSLVVVVVVMHVLSFRSKNEQEKPSSQRRTQSHTPNSFVTFAVCRLPLANSNSSTNTKLSTHHVSCASGKAALRRRSVRRMTDVASKIAGFGIAPLTPVHAWQFNFVRSEPQNKWFMAGNHFRVLPVASGMFRTRAKMRTQNGHHSHIHFGMPFRTEIYNISLK